jgi:putative acetyltransferase
MNETINLRPIKKGDNPFISKVIKSTLEEFNAAVEGTAYMDPETDAMFEAYRDSNSIYFVALLNNRVVGGAGIKQLKDGDPMVCELQKMYILPEARNKKIGKLLILNCLDFASSHSFSHCYLETFPKMESAIRLYLRNGFENIDHPLGNTCHYSCNVWMLKKLDAPGTEHSPQINPYSL